MTLAPIPLSLAEALLIDGAGWVQVAPGTLQFIQQAVLADENGNPVPLTEPWLQFVDTAAPGQPQGYRWSAVLGVRLAAPAQPLG